MASRPVYISNCVYFANGASRTLHILASLCVMAWFLAPCWYLVYYITPSAPSEQMPVKDTKTGVVKDKVAALIVERSFGGVTK